MNKAHKKLGTKLKTQAREIKKNLDGRLLELTSVSVDQVRNQWTKAAHKLDLDQDLPAYLVGRILEKAKTIRESLPSEEKVGKAFDQARQKVRAVQSRAQAARSGIVKNSPLKRRSKKSTTHH